MEVGEEDEVEEEAKVVPDLPPPPPPPPSWTRFQSPRSSCTGETRYSMRK